MSEARGWGNRTVAALRRAMQSHRKRHPDRYKARNKVNNWLRLGKISKPDACERCGSDEKLQAHHHDYSKPLDVEWICRPCHTEEHHGSRI